MGWLTNLVGGGDTVPKSIDALGNAFDKIFTSDDERAQAAVVMEKLRQHPAELQVELNKIEAGHRTIFVAGWRPFIGWVCGVGLAFVFLINPIIQWTTGESGPEMPLESVFSLVIALLGMGGLRTIEKNSGKAK